MAINNTEVQLTEKLTLRVNAVYTRVLGGVAGWVASLGVRPNAVTLASLLPAMLAGWAAYVGVFWLAAVLLLASGVLDLIDGTLARQTGQTSRFGALLDSTVDRLCDAAVPVGLAVFYAPFGPAILVPILLILSGFTISYVRARAEGLSYDLPRLWMRREDRLLVTVVALFLAPISISGIALPAPITFITLALLGLLGLVAVAMALLFAARQT